MRSALRVSGNGWDGAVHRDFVRLPTEGTTFMSEKCQQQEACGGCSHRAEQQTSPRQAGLPPYEEGRPDDFQNREPNEW
jgi:hypothetical protein